MADKPLGYGPQGLALELNPWQTTASIEAAHKFRGAIIGAWASVETAIIEVAIRSSAHPAYLNVRTSYPSKLKGRVQYLRQIADIQGPLLPYRKIIHSALDRYEDTASFRNKLAHSRMRVLPEWGATFEGFIADSGIEIRHEKFRLTLDDFEQNARAAARFSRTVNFLLSRLNRLGSFPSLDDVGGA